MNSQAHPPSRARSKQGGPANIRSGTAATLDSILKEAYRRHSRGKLARAAMTACLGR
jgi:hypothetical protein